MNQGNPPKIREGARAVVAYLESIADADNKVTSLDMTEERKSQYVGRYSFGRGKDDALEVLLNRRSALAIQRGDRSSRTLHRIEDHAFAPAGAPNVRIRFEIESGRAVALSVHDPFPLVRATRVR